ncbi:MAG: hypothetical protein JRJ33_11375 [Deltaproteobacteria bacterium]|nr:hypothetical protein [Deltaproteobacteria bacterium]
MKQLLEFLRTTALGGLFVLLPLLLLYLLLSEALGLIVVLAGPIADLFPKASLGRWIERMVLNRLPVYKALKSLTTGFAEAGKDGAFKTAVLKSSNGEREIVYVIEDYGNGQHTVLLPLAPTAFSGFVKVVDRDRLEILDANLGDVSRVLSHWGVGTRNLLDQHRIVS